MPRSAIIWILAAVVVFFVLLTGIVIWKVSTKEHYNAGNNIDFDKTKNDSEIPEDALAKGDVFFRGGRFSYIVN